MAVIVIIFAIVMAWMIMNIPNEPAYGQHTSLGSVEAVESATKPTTFAGTWVRTTDSREFSASSTTGKWLGTEQTFHFGKNATGVTGALNMTANVPCDTTDVAWDGYTMSDSAYISVIRCTNDGGITAACSLEVFVNNGRIYAGAWTGQTEVFNPAALVWPSGKFLSVYIKSGAQNPSRPMVDVIARPFVSQ